MALSDSLSGRIAYRDADGRESGYEEFDLVTSAADGSPVRRLLRALCVMNDIGLMREVSIGMTADWRPTDGQCRVWQDGRESLMRFSVTPDAVHCDGNMLSLAAPLPYLGLHSLSGDALICHQRGTDAAGVYRAIDAVTNSISPNGDEGLALQAMTIGVAYIGATPLAIAAGQFEAWHYRLRWREDWPPADLWVRQGDGLFLLMRWPLVTAWYELTALRSPQVG